MKKRKNKNVVLTIKLKLRQKLFCVFVILLVVCLLCFLIMGLFINPIIKKTGKSKISAEAGESISKAISDAMQGTITYDDLIHIVTDNNGKITLLQANSIQINTLTRKVIECAYKEVTKSISGPLVIPLGAFTGLAIFSGVGPKVKIDAVPYVAVNCNFLSKFISAGINQTVHQIYLKVSAEVTLVMPFVEASKIEETEVLVSESLIIGEIPETYLKAAETGDLLNMVG